MGITRTPRTGGWQRRYKPLIPQPKLNSTIAYSAISRSRIRRTDLLVTLERLTQPSLVNTQYSYTTLSETDTLVTGTRYTFDCAHLAFDVPFLGQTAIPDNSLKFQLDGVLFHTTLDDFSPIGAFSA